MEYSKQPLSFDALADLLIQRGLRCEKVIIIELLKSVSYYRLSGYWYPFKNQDNIFKPGTTLIFGILSICRFLSKLIVPQSKWPDRLENLLETYPALPKQSMGFPENWKQSPLWQ